MKSAIKTGKFLRAYARLSDSDQKAVTAAMNLFLIEPYHPSLDNHKLKGKMQDFYSLSAGYDLRIIYLYENNRMVVVFVNVGKHKNVYH